MHSFHSGTKPNHYYGTTTYEEGKKCFHNGSLTNSLINGYMFIADELNLSTVSNMNALAPALEMNFDTSIYFPGIENPINIHPKFFFVVCQNEVCAKGRNALPHNIKRRFKEIFYPPLLVEDITKICKEIINNRLYRKVIDERTAEKLGEFMIKLNKENFSEISQWSIRDIKKIFQRQLDQSKQPEKYQGISFCHNLLFYTLSSVSKEEIPNVKEKVIKIIQEVFELSIDDRNNLNECFNSKAELKYNNQGDLCIYKGKCCVNCELYKKFFGKNDTNFHLTSLIETLFQIMLSSDDEPILLIGPSGYKTFLAKIILSNAKIITLNQDSSFEQLLGSSSIFSETDINYFYLRLISLMCRFDNYYILHERLKKGNLDEREIEEIIEEMIYRRNRTDVLPHSFLYAIKRSRDKIFMKKKDDDEVNDLLNMIIEFNPGLLLQAFLGGSSLILKNLHYLPSNILERFNKSDITINEDIYNTITPESNKTLSIKEFNRSFRIFGTCLSGTSSQLSETILSRFSLIHVGEYSLVEQKMALKSYCNINNLKIITDDNINKIIECSIKLKDSFSGIDFTLFQMFNLLRIANNMNIRINKDRNNKYKNNEYSLSLIIYYSFRGLLYNREPYILKKLCEIVNLTRPPEKELEKYITPLYLDESDNIGIYSICSKITPFIFSPYTSCDKHSMLWGRYQNITFSPQFNEMVEIVHFGLANKIPVILEGKSGQGKHLCINYINELLGYEIVNINISQYTKIEDLLGRKIIKVDENKNVKNILKETKLLQALKEYNNKIFIFNNINNASPSVLELLTSIFDKTQEYLLLPDGSTIYKNPINIIGISNVQNGLKRDQLLHNLAYSPLYHIVLEPDNESIMRIIENHLEKEEIEEDGKKLYEIYMKAKYIMEKKYQRENVFNLNDIIKFINFRKISYGEINDVSIIYALIFLYRFTEEEIINDLKKQLQIQTIDMEPTLFYDKPIGTLTYKIGNNNEIQIKTFFEEPLNSEQIEDLERCFNTLTSNQKICILFLILCSLSKSPAIIQGETASGKSHVIRAFAYLMGKKLNVYQLNSESNTYLLFGQPKLNTTITRKESEELSKIFNNLKRFEIIEDIINDSFREEKYEEWNAELFKKLFDIITKVELKANAKEKQILKLAKREIGKIIFPLSRFTNDCGAFVNSMKRGEWVLFDGIESTTPQLSEKLLTLVGEDPEIDLCETGKDQYFFTKKKKITNSTIIHDDFLMFICYNVSSKNNNCLEQKFFNKCMCFSMTPIDSKEIDSAKILYGSLIKNNLDEKISYSIATRLSFVHKYVKDKFKNEEDFFSGELQPTGRTLGFIGKEFSKYLNEKKNYEKLKIYRPICNSIIFFYANSYTPTLKDEEGKIITSEKNEQLKAKFIDELVNTFIKNVPRFNFDNEKNFDVLLILKEIQEYSVDPPHKRKKLDNFIFSKLVKLCIENTELKDIELIIKHLSDTYELLSKAEISDQIKSLYYQINILNKLLKDINLVKNEISEQSKLLSDKRLLQIDELDVPLSRLYLFERLVKDQEIFSCNIQFFKINNNLKEFMISIIELYKTKEKLSFNKMLQILKTSPELFEIIDLIFPYKHFSNSVLNNITYLMDLFTRLYLTKINFTVLIDKDKYDFQTTNNQLKMTCLFEINNNFLLDINTTIQRVFVKGQKPNELFKLIPQLIKDSNKDCILWNYYIYLAILDIIKRKEEEIVDQKSMKIMISQFIGKIEKPKLNKNDKSFNISNCFNPDDKSSLFGKAWGIVLIFDKNFLDYINTFCYPFEKQLINLAYVLNQIIEPKYIESIVNICESMKFFHSRNSILWQINTGNFIPESSKISLYKKAIKEEKEIIYSVFNGKIDLKYENLDFHSMFIEAQEKIYEFEMMNDKNIIIEKNSIKKFEINPDIFDFTKLEPSSFNFDEEMILKIVLGKMKEIEDKRRIDKPLPELRIKEDLKEETDYRKEKPLNNIFNVIELYKNGMSLANKIIKNISEKKIPFSHISVNLLLDCSGFISIENKLKQFVIICGIVNALNIVNIPYAISLVGDIQFCTLKPFNLEHSMENLQIIFDCLFIKRFFTKNANAIQYALKFTQTKSSYRTILIFTDGLDEDFLLIESWKKNLFNNYNFSFGFFFY